MHHQHIHLEKEPLFVLRNRVLYPFSIIGATFLLPFSLNDFYQGRYLLGTAILALVCMHAANIIAIRNNRRPVIPFALLLIPGAASIVISVSTQGISGLMWCYPALLFFYFALPKRLAKLCTGLLLLAASAMCYQTLGSGTTIRFVASMIAMMVATNIILGVMTSLQQQLQQQTIRDPLTGAYNRRHLEVSVAAAVDQKFRHGAAVSLLMLDVDYFKRINDELGHEAGDSVLLELVRLIETRIRKRDLLFRSGGEEFMVLLADTNAEQATIVAEQLRTEIEQATLSPDRSVTVSIGVAELKITQTRDDWLSAADDAMYCAKRNGRNQVVTQIS